MQGLWRTGVAACLAVLVGGCAEGERFPSEDCTPNDRKACSCDDNRKGWQLCRQDRTYEPCGCSSNDLSEGPAQASCGNGRLESGETCDDGNTKNGDGCSALCLQGDALEARKSCAGLRPLPLEPGVDLSGRQSLDGAVDDVEGSCGGGGAEVVFAFAPTASGTLALTLAPDDGADVVLYVRAGACDDEAAEPAGGCGDGAGDGAEEALRVPVEAGTAYFVFAEARGGGGDVKLSARLEGDGGACEAEGQPCETGLSGDCAAGTLACFEGKYLVCRPDVASCS